jgi:FixJ family two-component response regulator
VHLKGLSPRQRAVLDLVANGRSNKQIAGDLGISQRTVETHRVIVMRKLGARNFADLMRLVAAWPDLSGGTSAAYSRPSR